MKRAAGNPILRSEYDAPEIDGRIMAKTDNGGSIEKDFIRSG